MVCQYLKKNPDVRFRVNRSTYFNPDGQETVLSVFRDAKTDFKTITIYAHLKRHQAKQRETALTQPVNPIITTMKLVEGPNGESQHEMGLDEFITEGRNKLARGELLITSNTYLQALKIKHDADKSNKDRRMDALKALFAGGAASGNQPNTETSTEATT